MLDVIAGDENLTMTEASGFGVTFLAFNTQRAPFDNADVRNAIYMAMDLDSYQENLVKTAGTGSTPPALLRRPVHPGARALDRVHEQPARPHP